MAGGVIYFRLWIIDRVCRIHRYSPTTGQRRCICKRIARSSCTRRAAFIIAPEYLALAVRWLTTSPAAMRSSVPLATKCTG